MDIFYARSFKKSYNKLPARIQQRCIERLELFARDPHHQLLYNHRLKGRFAGYRSINITGDIRAIYKPLNEHSAYFVEVDSHSKLYNS